MLSTQESPSREGDGLLFTYGKGIFGRLGHGIKDSYTLSEKSKLLPSRVGSKRTVARAGIRHAQR